MNAKTNTFIYFLQNKMNFLLKVIRYIISQHRWILIYKNKSSGVFTEIEQPLNLARADCFMVQEHGKTYVFFEEFVIEPNRKGYLCVGELDANANRLLNVRKILEQPYHLSYPFVFKYQNEWYMIPETHSNSCIDLYKLTSFPDNPQKVKTLINNIDAVDTTILFKDGLVYLFTNIKHAGKTHNEDLSIFYSADLLNGDFKPHPQNPIKSSSKYSRMAGKIIEKNGEHYRFAQDCSIDYGAKMYQFKIEELSTQSYKETLINSVPPPTVKVAWASLPATLLQKTINTYLWTQSKRTIRAKILLKISKS